MKMIKSMAEADREREAVEKLYISGISKKMITYNIPISEFEKQIDAFNEIRICPYCQVNTYYQRHFIEKFNIQGKSIKAVFIAKCERCGSMYQSEPFSKYNFYAFSHMIIAAIITIILILGKCTNFVFLTLACINDALSIFSLLACLILIDSTDFIAIKSRKRNVIYEERFDELWNNCVKDKTLSSIRNDVYNAHITYKKSDTDDNPKYKTYIEYLAAQLENRYVNIYEEENDYSNDNKKKKKKKK